MPKILVVTTSRAEYGQLYWLMKKIEQTKSFRLQLAVSGAHLSSKFGQTDRWIQKDGFKIDAKIPLPLGDDSALGIARAMACATLGFAKSFQKLKPDLLVLLGDRYETLAAAQAALVARIPIAHLCGGDVTEGVFDEAMRHSITKMSQLHFVTNAQSALRVRQLGENPKFIFNVGNPALDQIRNLNRLPKTEIERRLNFSFKKNNFLITFHPATLSADSPEREFQELLKALGCFGEDTALFFTRPNADAGNRAISKRMDSFVKNHKNARVYTAMGSELYLNVMAHADAVIGNSSSGITEAPSLGLPTVNIGNRQKGRLKAASVIDCKPKSDSISRAIEKALKRGRRPVKNPYGDGRSSEKIVHILKKIKSPQPLILKRFFDRGSCS